MQLPDTLLLIYRSCYDELTLSKGGGACAQALAVLQVHQVRWSSLLLDLKQSVLLFTGAAGISVEEVLRDALSEYQKSSWMEF